MSCWSWRSLGVNSIQEHVNNSYSRFRIYWARTNLYILWLRSKQCIHDKINLNLNIIDIILRFNPIYKSICIFFERIHLGTVCFRSSTRQNSSMHIFRKNTYYLFSGNTSIYEQSSFWIRQTMSSRPGCESVAYATDLHQCLKDMFRLLFI